MEIQTNPKKSHPTYVLPRTTQNTAKVVCRALKNDKIMIKMA